MIDEWLALHQGCATYVTHQNYGLDDERLTVNCDAHKSALIVRLSL